MKLTTLTVSTAFILIVATLLNIDQLARSVNTNDLATTVQELGYAFNDRGVAPGSLLAPMPGSVVRLAVALGDTVTAGQPMLWLEAMKMQHQINAPADGVVSELPVTQGQQVDVGAVLAVVSAGQNPEGDTA